MKQSYRVVLAASLLTLFASPAFAYHGMHGSPDRPAWSTGMPYSGNQAGWDRWHHHRHGPWMHPRHYRPLPPPPRFYGPPHRGMKGMRPYGPMHHGMPYQGSGKAGPTRKGAYGPQKYGKSEAAAAGNSIAAVAQAAGGFETLLAAAEAAGLKDALSVQGPFTVFAPTDEAFAALPEGTVENLLQPENRAELERLLQHHIVSGRLPADEVLASESLETLAGTTLQVTLNGEQAQIGGADIKATNVMAGNGVIHVIDAVLIP
jgi:uncharacterized surface protein with fasciclin (FAS1) repeats